MGEEPADLGASRLAAYIAFMVMSTPWATGD
jgi:hypothetical protein